MVFLGCRKGVQARRFKRSLNLVKELIVNLQGKLDSILGNAFREKTDRFLREEPYKILLDASELGGWDDEGLTFLKQSAQDNGSSSFAASGLSSELAKDWERLGLSARIPFFPTREQAKSYLLSEHRGSGTSFVSESTAACPSCLQILRVKGQGNYRCPSCSHTFYLTADYRTASYEKLF